jgi:hypothetical protein
MSTLAVSHSSDVLLASSQNIPGFGDQPIWITLIKVVCVFVFMVFRKLF